METEWLRTAWPFDPLSIIVQTQKHALVQEREYWPAQLNAIYQTFSYVNPSVAYAF